MPTTSLGVGIPTLIGSIVSFLSCTVFAIIYIVFPPKRHYRQILICNLLLADWINSLNNTISGIAVISDWKHRNSLDPGPACTANAWVGQFSVQAIDFNFLVISLSVLMTARKNNVTPEQSCWKLLLVCFVPWIMPIITSNIGLALGAYGPATGNWCWITSEHFGDRYALTHGWRIGIFVITIIIYTWVYIHLRRIYGRLARDSHTSQTTSVDPHARSTVQVIEEIELSSTSQHDDERLLRSNSAGTALKEDVESVNEPYIRPTRELRNMLLLNGYPILYILLWIPGIANRIVEAFGPSPLWLQGLQSTTQWMGFADMITYAFNEQLVRRIRMRWREREGVVECGS
ncbi:hypothetical protein LTR62_004412 [Meristemomyces frigidus]|uniref:Glucose receptor Git3-like N-terminal domain-containing protein n=1 Tax=Meristemomyces frigidus TaxID=1508187 RepID=A0AAN7TEQ1_9PEZI|nr:hypothetical protein LTR62_004412 [Meristemomyces frigidus]